MGSMSKYFNGGSYVGKIEPKPVRKFQPITEADGSVWLCSGSVVPAAQAPLLAGNDAYRCVGPSVVNTPFSLGAGGNFKFVQGATAAVGFYINVNNGTYMYTTNTGDSWTAGSMSGLSSAILVGARINGTGVEIFAIQLSNSTLYRAVIAAGTPETCTFASTSLVISADTSYLQYGSYAYDATNTRHLFVWTSATTGVLNSITSTNGTSWSANTGVSAGNVAGGGYYVRIAAKSGGGFTVIAAYSGSPSNATIYSTSTGASYSSVATNISLVAAWNGGAPGNAVYVGSRLFIQTISGFNYSDDNGATVAQGQNLSPINRWAISGVSYFGLQFDGTRLVLYYIYGNAYYIVHSTDGLNFSAVPYVNGGDSFNNTAPFVMGQKFFLPAQSNNLSRLFKTDNTFTPNSSTDFVGLPEFEPVGFYLTPHSLANHLRIS